MRGSCSPGDLPDHSSSLPRLSPAFWTLCRGMAMLLNLLVWVIFSRGIWPHEPPGMGKDCSPNGLGSSWVVVGGSSVALLCEGAGRPMGCLTYPPTKAWEASPHLLQRCSVASLGAWHNLAKEPLARLPPPQPFSQLCRQKGPQSNNKLQLCLPLLVSVSFFYETNILLEGCVLPVVHLPGASSCNPSSHLGFKVVHYKCRGLHFCPASLHACNASEQNSQKRIRAALRNSLSPVWAWRPCFHALVTREVQSMSAKEHHCCAPRCYSGKWSAQCNDLAVTFLSLPSCNGVGEKNSCWGFFPLLV